jgi:hypothetical protein
MVDLGDYTVTYGSLCLLSNRSARKGDIKRLTRVVHPLNPSDGHLVLVTFAEVVRPIRTDRSVCRGAHSEPAGRTQRRPDADFATAGNTPAGPWCGPLPPAAGQDSHP